MADLVTGNPLPVSVSWYPGGVERKPASGTLFGARACERAFALPITPDVAVACTAKLDIDCAAAFKWAFVSDHRLAIEVVHAVDRSLGNAISCVGAIAKGVVSAVMAKSRAIGILTEFIRLRPSIE